MNYFALQSIISSFISIAIGLYALEKDPRKELNRIFCLAAFMTGYLSFIEYGYRIAVNVEEAAFWYGLGSIWPFVIAMTLHLIIVYTDSFTKQTKHLIYGVTYLLVVFISIFQYQHFTHAELRREYWGWVISIAESTYMIVSVSWFIVITVSGLALCYKSLLNEKRSHRQKQTKIFIAAISLPLMTMLITGFFLQYLGIFLPDLSTTALMLGMLIIGIGIRKYGLFVVSPEKASLHFINKAHEAFLFIDRDQQIVFANKATYHLFNRSQSELSKSSLWSLIVNNPSGNQVYFRNRLRQLDNLFDFETAIMPKNKPDLSVSISAFVQWEPKGEILGHVVMVRDISDQEKTRLDLKDTEEKYRTVLESLLEGYYELDLEGRFTMVNDAYLELTGFSRDALIGKSIFDMTHSQTATRLREIFQTIRETKVAKKSIRFKFKQQQGHSVLLEMSVTLKISDQEAPMGFNGLTRDISERAQMEEILVQSEKLISLGGLAAGIAHEINNPLAGILQTLHVVKNRLIEDSKKNQAAAKESGLTMENLSNYLNLRQIPERIDMMKASGRRISEIIDNMLSFSRKGGAVFGMCSLCDLLDKTLILLAAEFDLKKRLDFKGIQIIREYEAGIPRIPCESSKLQQVFFNLLKNGTQAMSENLKTGKSRHFILRIKTVGHFTQIEIEDNGPGMDEETASRIFEPFFTTKQTSGGTGLGLSISYFIITENHHGTMSVESEPGQGAKFIIQLPNINEI